jgi:hypothetical protein
MNGPVVTSAKEYGHVYKIRTELYTYFDMATSKQVMNFTGICFIGSFHANTQGISFLGGKFHDRKEFGFRLFPRLKPVFFTSRIKIPAERAWIPNSFLIVRDSESVLLVKMWCYTL